MPQTVSEIMTPDPVTIGSEMTARDAARIMRERNIGDVIVTEDGRFHSIVTDRDLVLKVLAEGLDGSQSRLSEICAPDPVTLTPDEPVRNAVELMRSRAIRRLPVVDGDQVRGIITLGDLAIQHDPESALADISNAAPNND